MESIQKNYTIVQNIGKVLLDDSRPLKERFRALFTLRNIGGELSVRCIEKCFTDSSALLKHECAYCLGQMQDPLAAPKLISILQDTHQEPIVRHEAAEALSAIGLLGSLPVLTGHMYDPCLEIAETCQLSLQKMEENANPVKTFAKNPYKSVDPAHPFPDTMYSSLNELESILLDVSQPLYRRYKAMFTLRNMGTRASATVLAKGLTYGSALFRHEIAYVLGQMQNDVAVKPLAQVLFDLTQHEMVRHECAEALGSIATDECIEILKLFQADEKRLVRESCEVALDMCDYENSTEFQYANALVIENSKESSSSFESI